VTLYERRMDRLLERRERESSGECVPLHGRTYAEHEAATGEDAFEIEAMRDEERRALTIELLRGLFPP
jgi:hypothetical protein